MAQYVKERREKDQALLIDAQKQGYNLNFESGLQAEKDGKYEIAYLIYLYSPWNENNEKMKEIFLHKVMWTHLPRRENILARWATKEKNSNLTTIIRNRLDGYAHLWDKLSPLERFHSENLVQEYEKIGDFKEAARRAEGNPHSFTLADYPGVPQDLVGRFEELHNLTSWGKTFKHISSEELRKKVQAQNKKSEEQKLRRINR